MPRALYYHDRKQYAPVTKRRRYSRHMTARMREMAAVLRYVGRCVREGALDNADPTQVVRHADA